MKKWPRGALDMTLENHLKKELGFKKQFHNVSRIGAFWGKIVSNKNGNLKQFEKIATMTLENHLKKELGLGKVISSVSHVGFYFER